MAFQKSEKLVLRCTSAISLNDRFSLMLNAEPDEVDVTCDMTLLQRPHEASHSNRSLALQMENRPSVRSAYHGLHLKQRLGRASVRSRLGWAPGPAVQGKARGRVFFLGGLRGRGRGSLRTLGARPTTFRSRFPNRTCTKCVCGLRPTPPPGRLAVRRALGQRGGRVTGVRVTGVRALIRHRVRKTVPLGGRGRGPSSLRFNRPPGGGTRGGLAVAGLGAGKGWGVSSAMQKGEAFPTKEELDNQLDEYMSMSKRQLDAQLDEYMCMTDSFTLD